jgi:hypothetical protein
LFVVGGFGVPGGHVQGLVDAALRALPKRRERWLGDILDPDSRFGEMSQDEVGRRLEKMNDAGRTKLTEARARSVSTGRPVIGLFSYRGGRPIRVDGVVVGKGSLTEPRFDGLANALRVPKGDELTGQVGGGSSKQFVIVVDRMGTRMRILDPREAARLTGRNGWISRTAR